MGIYEDSVRLSFLAAGDNPAWEQQTDFTGLPEDDNDGVYLSGALRTLCVVRLRQYLHFRRSQVTITTLDLTSVYRITIDGNNTNYDAGGAGAATLQDVLDGIAAAINANGSVNTIVLAETGDLDADGVDDCVGIRGLTDANYTVAFTVVSGSAVMAVAADPRTATLRIYGQLKGPSNTRPPGWTLIADAIVSVDRYGWSEMLNTAGYDRLYLELADVAGAGDGGTVTYLGSVYVGPSVVS